MNSMVSEALQLVKIVSLKSKPDRFFMGTHLRTMGIHDFNRVVTKLAIRDHTMLLATVYTGISITTCFSLTRIELQHG